MDTKTGDIFRRSDLNKLAAGEVNVEDIKEMVIAPTKKQLARVPMSSLAIGKVGRNDKCPCNRGKKFKKCCLNKH